MTSPNRPPQLPTVLDPEDRGEGKRGKAQNRPVGSKTRGRPRGVLPSELEVVTKPSRRPLSTENQQEILAEFDSVTESGRPRVVRVLAAEIKKLAIPLTTAHAGSNYEDLEALGAAIGNARVVALGEPTHGTRQVFQMKHRLLEYLVLEKSFTVFAIEANWPESEAANSYVKTGEGDARSALAAMNLWTWYTEEMLALLEWMREFNKAPGDHATLSFTSFDMQTCDVARHRVIDFVKQYCPEDLASVEFAYANSSGLTSEMLSDHELKDFTDADAVVTMLEGRREALVSAATAGAFRDVLQLARTVVQTARLRNEEKCSYYRDKAMASNIEWLLNEKYPKHKILVWAHNLHVSMMPSGTLNSMGNCLRGSLGTRMYVLGFAIHSGTVRAVTTEGGQCIGPAESVVPQADAGTGTEMLSAVGLPLFFLDLRNRVGAVGKWLCETHLFRGCGSTWDRDKPEAFMLPETLSRAYDGLIFLEDTRAARGLNSPSGLAHRTVSSR